MSLDLGEEEKEGFPKVLFLKFVIGVVLVIVSCLKWDELELSFDLQS